MKNKEGIAVINGDVVRVGDNIGNYVVEFITDNRVDLVSALGERATLWIRQDAIPGYKIKGKEITNIQEEPTEKKKTINVLPKWTPPPTLPAINPADKKQ